MSGLSGMEIVRLIKSDKEALRELAASIAADSEIRLAVVNAVLAEVATKRDLERLREELREEFRRELSELRSEVRDIRREMNTHFRWIVGLVVIFWGATVIPLLMRMAGVI